MNSDLNHLLAQQRATDLKRAGERARLASETRLARALSPDMHACPVTIRWATPDDIASVREIADLDSRRPPSGACLVAELGDEMVAVLSIETGDVVANPFRHTAHAVALLRVRAKQLTVTRRSLRTGLRRLRLGRLVVDAR
jgi:hypothetical protein